MRGGLGIWVLLNGSWVVIVRSGRCVCSCVLVFTTTITQLLTTKDKNS